MVAKALDVGLSQVSREIWVTGLDIPFIVEPTVLRAGYIPQVDKRSASSGFTAYKEGSKLSFSQKPPFFTNVLLSFLNKLRNTLYVRLTKEDELFNLFF